MDNFTDYMNKGWKKYEAFEAIYKNNPPRKEYREGDIIVLWVAFNPSGKLYCYYSKDNIYKPGDLVEVTVYNSPRVVEVKYVGYYSPDANPYKEVYLNTINGPASGDLAAKYKEAIEEELQREADMDKVREEAKKLLEEARNLKMAATEEKKLAYEEREKAEQERSAAEQQRKEAEQQRKEAEQQKKEAEHERAQAEEDRKEAARVLAEAEEKREEIRRLADQTVVEGKKARKENARLERAREEAKKVWKRKRPKTDNEVILGLRGVQDALDSDEEIYKGLSALEEKMVKVMKRADEVMADGSHSSLMEEIERLYEFYFPKTVDVLEQYRNIFSSGLPPKSVAGLRADVLEAVAKSGEVYDNILEDLYKSDMIELTAELKALQSMFAINGLLDD